MQRKLSCSKTEQWVTDFRALNRALKRPVWGSESSQQLLHHIDLEAKNFATFEAISGYHQVAIDESSSDLLSIITQMGSLKYRVLAQGDPWVQACRGWNARHGLPEYDTCD